MNTTKRAASKKGNSHGKEPAKQANVGQIRDIIFGDTMRIYDEKFSVLERKINSITSNLSNDLDRRLERLEQVIRREVDKVRERQQKDKEKYNADAKEHKVQLREMESYIESRVEELDGELSKEYQVLQSTVNEQSEAMIQMLDETRYQLDENLSKQTHALNSNKIARDELAQLLSELAKQIKSKK